MNKIGLIFLLISTTAFQANEILDFASSAATSIANGAESAASTVADVASSAATTVASTASDIGNSAASIANTVVDSVGSGASAVGDVASSAANIVVDAAGSAATAVGNTAVDLVDEAGNLANDAGNAISSGASSVTSSVESGLEELGNATVSIATSAVDAVSNTASDAIDTVGSTISSAVDEASIQLGLIKNGTSILVSSVGQAISDQLSKLWPIIIIIFSLYFFTKLFECFKLTFTCCRNLRSVYRGFLRIICRNKDYQSINEDWSQNLFQNSKNSRYLFKKQSSFELSQEYKWISIPELSVTIAHENTPKIELENSLKSVFFFQRIDVQSNENGIIFFIGKLKQKQERMVFKCHNYYYLYS